MIDLSPMKLVDVDPRNRTARAQGGVTWGEFDRETHVHGLATTGGTVSATGIAGLTLGGGFGWLMGTRGLTVDNVVSVELVTAAGDVLIASAAEDPDLFWALRGGGGNFGVATSFEYRLHPHDQVVGGLIAYPFEAASDVLRFYRRFTESVSDELTVYAALIHAPDGSGVPLAAFVVCHTGPRHRAEAELEPLLAYGSPALTQIGPMPYPTVNTLLDSAYPMGSLNYWKSSLLTDLDEGAIDVMIDRFAACPSPMTAIALEHLHGAMTRVDAEDTAIPHREPGYNVLITSVWSDPAATQDNIAWTRSTYDALEPSLASGRYVNYLGGDDIGDTTRAAYGTNIVRLAAVKRRYDPDNVFHLNQNIEPAPMSG